MFYLDGIGVERSYPLALRWLSSAADQGAPRAIVNLGAMYEQGLGVEQDMDEAIRLYEQAAGRNEFMAFILLARIHVDGRGRLADQRKAAEWYRQALALEHAGMESPELDEARQFLQKTGLDREH